MACGRKKINARTSLPVFRRPPYAPVSLPGLQFLLQKSIHWTLPVFTAVFGSVLFKSMSPLSTPGRFGMLLSSKAFGTAILCSFDFRIRTDTFFSISSAVNCTSCIHENGSAPMHPLVLFLHSSKILSAHSIHLPSSSRNVTRSDFQFLRYVYGCNDRETCCLRLNAYDRQSS